MRRLPGEFTIIDGGADGLAAAMRKGDGILMAATTVAPSPVRATEASGVIPLLSTVVRCDGADAPTAPASTSGASTAIPKAGVRITRPALLRTLARAAEATEAGSPAMRTQPS